VIPTEHLPAVTRALQSAFNTDTYDEIQAPSGGLSPSLVYRIVVKGSPYLLRIISKKAWGDPSREFAAMQAGSDAGIAPRIHSSSLEDRLILTDFIATQPYPADIALHMARTLRTLHALPPFPPPARGEYLATMDGFVQRFKAANLLPESLAAEIFAGYDAIFAAYRALPNDQVSCHNDVKPQNALFDGNRVWLVDWEAAFLNDRYVDLAIAANFFVPDEAPSQISSQAPSQVPSQVSEQSYLAAYFGEPAGPHRTARFYLMRQLLQMFYPALMCVMISAIGDTVPQLSLDDAPDFADFHRRLISGEIPLTTPAERLEYSRAHLARFYQNLHSPRLAESLALLAEAR
jgi:aminoglycoside phosphotransferase (APT) family kinase protein